MRQIVGKGEVLLAAVAAANADPTGDQAGRLVMATAFGWVMPNPICWMMQVTIENTAGPQVPVAYEASAALWAREKQNLVWGQLGIKDGQVNDGELITGTGITVSRFFMYQNLGLFQDLYLRVADVSGADFSLRADLFPVWVGEDSGIVPG